MQIIRECDYYTGRTVLVIAHRLSTIQNAGELTVKGTMNKLPLLGLTDSIVVLSDGGIKEVR